MGWDRLPTIIHSVIRGVLVEPQRIDSLWGGRNRRVHVDCPVANILPACSHVFWARGELWIFWEILEQKAPKTVEVKLKHIFALQFLW